LHGHLLLALKANFLCKSDWGRSAVYSRLVGHCTERFGFVLDRALCLMMAASLAGSVSGPPTRSHHAAFISALAFEEGSLNASFRVGP
jgi:hypothetical protein